MYVTFNDSTPKEVSMRYLTVAEYAAMMKLSEQAIRRGCESGAIAAVKVGSRWRIPYDGDSAERDDGANMEVTAALMAAKSMLAAVKDTLERLEAAI